MNFKTLFNQYTSILTTFKKELEVFDFRIDQLKDIGKTIKEDKNTFSYEFTKFKIVIPRKLKPSHTMPKGVEKITITLSVDDTIAVKRFNNLRVEDPFLNLDNFNIILNCEDTHYSSWHLDRHIMDRKEGDGDNLHPIYHMTYGGHYMESKQEDGLDVFGKSLIIRAPRLMHPPLELILGLDFVFRHYISRASLPLLDHKPYIKLIEDMKRDIWFPFALALTKNYCTNIEVDNQRYTFDDYFVQRVIGHNPPKPTATA